MEITALIPVYGIIYKVTNLVNGKSYIGQTTKSLRKRKGDHVRTARSNLGFRFHSAIRKYGIDNFKWDILDSCQDKESLNFKEKFYIYLYDTLRTGYNLASGGSNGNPYFGKSILAMKESIQKRKEKMQLKTDEEKQAISEKISSKMRGKNHCFYGKKRPEFAEKLKGKKPHCSMKGRTHSKETKEKISIGNKGKIFSKETLEKLRISKQKFIENRTDEYKRKYSATMSKVTSMGHNPNATKVLCVETQTIYSCLKEAKQILGLSSNFNIKNIMLGKNFNGFTFIIIEKKEQ